MVRVRRLKQPPEPGVGSSAFSWTLFLPARFAVAFPDWLRLGSIKTQSRGGGDGPSGCLTLARDPHVTQPVTRMQARIPVEDRTIARAFAVVTYAFSLLLAFFAGMLTGTPAAGAAPFVFLPGVGLALLSPFIWFGARWAMALVFLVAVALELTTVANSPGEWWLFVIVP